MCKTYLAACILTPKCTHESPEVYFYQELGRMAHWWGNAGTGVPFSNLDTPFIFRDEQFWGRAARASEIRKGLGRSLIFGSSFPLV